MKPAKLYVNIALLMAWIVILCGLARGVYIAKTAGPGGDIPPAFAPWFLLSLMLGGIQASFQMWNRRK